MSEDIAIKPVPGFQCPNCGRYSVVKAYMDVHGATFAELRCLRCYWHQDLGLIK